MPAVSHDAVGTADELQGFGEERHIIEGDGLTGTETSEPSTTLREHDQEEPQEAQDEGRTEESGNPRKRARRAARLIRAAKSSRHQPSEMANRERTSNAAFLTWCVSPRALADRFEGSDPIDLDSPQVGAPGP